MHWEPTLLTIRTVVLPTMRWFSEGRRFVIAWLAITCPELVLRS